MRWYSAGLTVRARSVCRMARARGGDVEVARAAAEPEGSDGVEEHVGPAVEGRLDPRLELPAPRDPLDEVGHERVRVHRRAVDHEVGADDMPHLTEMLPVPDEIVVEEQPRGNLVEGGRLGVEDDLPTHVRRGAAAHPPGELQVVRAALGDVVRAVGEEVPRHEATRHHLRAPALGDLPVRDRARQLASSGWTGGTGKNAGAVYHAFPVDHGHASSGVSVDLTNTPAPSGGPADLRKKRPPAIVVSNLHHR